MKISKCQLPAALTKLQMQIAAARPELLKGSESLMASRWHSLAGLPKLPWASDDARTKHCSALWSLFQVLEGTGAVGTKGQGTAQDVLSRVLGAAVFMYIRFLSSNGTIFPQEAPHHMQVIPTEKTDFPL